MFNSLFKFLKRRKRRRSKKYYAGLVQKAVEVSVRIKADIDRIAKEAQEKIVFTQKVPEDGTWKRIRRRQNALHRIAMIQAEAFKKAYGHYPPNFERLMAIPRGRLKGITTGEEIP